MNKKAELNKKENLFYVFVALKGEKERPAYFIVPSIIVAENVAIRHANWLATPGKKGQAHNASDMRTFSDNDEEYLERWELFS